MLRLSCWFDWTISGRLVTGCSTRCLSADEPDRNLKIIYEWARHDNIMDCISTLLLVESEDEHRSRLEDLMIVSKRLHRALRLPAEEPNREAKIFMAREKLQIILEFFASTAHLPTWESIESNKLTVFQCPNGPPQGHTFNTVLYFVQLYIDLSSKSI